jgi:hypothetical protein
VEPVLGGFMAMLIGVSANLSRQFFTVIHSAAQPQQKLIREPWHLRSRQGKCNANERECKKQ